MPSEAHDPLLATAGFPPFGANGIALNSSQTALFIANTGDKDGNYIKVVAEPDGTFTVENSENKFKKEYKALSGGR